MFSAENRRRTGDKVDCDDEQDTLDGSRELRKVESSCSKRREEHGELLVSTNRDAKKRDREGRRTGVELLPSRPEEQNIKRSISLDAFLSLKGMLEDSQVEVRESSDHACDRPPTPSQVQGVGGDHDLQLNEKKRRYIQQELDLLRRKESDEGDERWC